MLLSLTMKKAEREGDSSAIMAIKIILVMFFYGASKNSSKYSPTLMMNIVDYQGASTLTKKRMDLLATSNMSGKVGCNIHQDNKVMTKNTLITTKTSTPSHLVPYAIPFLKLSLFPL